MYERFYGLSRTPFAVTPDPAMLFMSKVHREALATIIYGVETRKGFLVCTGEVGTGKSTIVRAFFDQVREDAVKLIYIFTPQVTPFEMARYICGELGMADPESIFAAVPRLQLKLLETFESGRTVVLMIDEAQLLPVETLEFLRLLSNFETDTEKLIQIVLVGQPEVDTMLARPDMRQVNQRVALRARLAGLEIEESYDYIEHRLRVCGAEDLAQVMSPSAAWLIAEAAGGIPRRINILGDNALIAGFGAAQRPLGSQLAGAAVREFLGKSGAAAPARQDRFAAGRRAARRLRGALAREKGEPDEWTAMQPRPALPNGDNRPASPSRATVVQPVRHVPTEWQVAAVERPGATASAVLAATAPMPVEPAAPAPPRPTTISAPALVEPVEPPKAPPRTVAPAEAEAEGNRTSLTLDSRLRGNDESTDANNAPIAIDQSKAPQPTAIAPLPSEPAMAGNDRSAKPTARPPRQPNPVIAESPPIFVEPVGPESAWPSAVSFSDIAVIEPVAESPVPVDASVSLDGIVFVEPVPSPATEEPGPRGAEPQRSEPAFPIPHITRAAIPRPQSSTLNLRQTPWPALSRVRSGLRAPPHRYGGERLG